MGGRALLLGLLLIGSAGQAWAAWWSESAAIMGTTVTVEVWDEDPARAARAIQVGLAELRRIDALLSPYKEDSELARINRLGAGAMLAVSAETLDLIRRSLRVSELTGGAFDISFAAAGRLYDYRAGIRPDATALTRAQRRIDYRSIRVDAVAGRVGLGRAGMSLDLGGIAKGYAVEMAVARLRELGVGHALVSAGGDTRVLGDRRGRPWMVALRDPRDPQGLLTRTPLVDEAISTSGDYERFFEADGERYHHILNPATGDSARELRSVTIIGPDATLTDALSTSVFVLGPGDGLALIEGLPGYESILVDRHGHMHYSAGLKPLAAVQGVSTP